MTRKLENSDYITEDQAKIIKRMFAENLKSYQEKDATVSDQAWLQQLFEREFPESIENKQDANDAIESVEEFHEILTDINECAKKGISSASWIEKKLQEASVGMSINEYGKKLQAIDDALYQNNMKIADALSRSADGHIKMSPNLDGNIAEHMIAKTAELSAFLQGSDVKVEVRDVFTPNSVDVRATDLKTGQYQNYQLKFGKDAKATIGLIESGNYNNQQIVVPSEQLDEIQAHFKNKGSQKTISDHIEAFGVTGEKFTKQSVKRMQLAAQEDGIMPSMDYSHYQTKDLACAIGKNAAALSLQSAVVTTGLNLAHKIFNDELVDPNEMVVDALKTGVDTSVKLVTAGTLQVAVRKGVLTLIPKSTPAGIIANIACVGIENAKILGKIATGEMTISKGLNQMGNVTASMIGGLASTAKGFAIGASLTSWIPVVGPALGVVTGFIGGMIGYSAGSKIGQVIYETGKKVANVAKSVAKGVVSGLKSFGQAIGNGIKSAGGKLASLFGF